MKPDERCEPPAGSERQPARPGEKPISILIVVSDAGLRDRVFDAMAAAGYRVDAVFDRSHAQRRLSKDEYSVVVSEPGVLEVGDTTLPTVAVTEPTAISLEQLVRDVTSALRPGSER